MRFSRQILFSLALGLIVVSALFIGCGDQKPSDGKLGASGSCSPNVVDTGLQLSFEPITAGSNTFILTLCDDAQPKDAVYTVYGGVSLEDVTARTMNLKAAARGGHVTAMTSAGRAFQVTFNPTDNYFAIYTDSVDASGPQFDNSHAMVAPHPIPGR